MSVSKILQKKYAVNNDKSSKQKFRIDLAQILLTKKYYSGRILMIKLYIK